MKQNYDKNCVMCQQLKVLRLNKSIICRICNREVAGSNLSLGYFAPRSTQPSIPPGSVNEYQLRLGRQRQVGLWLIRIADERVGAQVKL